MQLNVQPVESAGNLLADAGKNASEFIKTNIGAIGAGVGGLALGGVLGAVATSKSRSAKARRRKKAKSRSFRKRTHRGRKLKFGSKAWRKKYSRRRKHQKQPHTAGKRKDTSHRRIRYTKKNQPYVIMGNGKARFISKKSASSSKKRQGGKY